MKAQSDLTQYRRILGEVLDRGDAERYSGYSKFDALESPLVRALSFNWWMPRLLWTQMVMRAPLNLRPLLLVRKGTNPKGVALFALANLTALENGMEGPFRERAKFCLDWLASHDSCAKGNFHGSCWGYHHAWQSPGFYTPPGYPNCVVTVFAAEAFLKAYQVLGERRYLSVARSAVDFILRDLPVFFEDNTQKCIAYVPHIARQFRVINNNALVGALLAKVGKVTAERHLGHQASKLMEFVVQNRTPYYAWYYTVDPGQTLITHDNYHTGGIIDALADYELATGDARYLEVYDRALDYYRSNLFLADGAPKWMNDKVYPFDVHGAAQGIITFALAGDLEFASNIAAWAIANLYKGNGNFSYQRTRYYTKRFTLMHWCNGWMARALSILLRGYSTAQVKSSESQVG